MRMNEKLKAIRMAEGLSQCELCGLIDLTPEELAEIEKGIDEPGGTALMKYTTNLRLRKYTLWLMNDSTSPEAGQVEPVLTHFGQGKITSRH